jgi:RNA polymerase nonessential primary-like sigma factor
MKANLHVLSDAEREFLTIRFGLDGSDVPEIEELATALGMTRERVRWVEKQIVAKLRRASEAA